MGVHILKCGGYVVNCTAKNQPVYANPDIAGIGVIVGFLSTTCLAFCVSCAVLFLDRYENAINFFRKYFTKNDEKYEHVETKAYWRSPRFWSFVLSKNLLALADTQLLTGLAIQFTAMLKHCQLSIYHFQIVTELAFLTTVTHLLTIVTLRNYFVKYKWINLPRVFFMLGNLALLGYTSFVSYSYDLANSLDVSNSLACFYQGRRPGFRSAFGGKWASLLIGAIGGHVAILLAMYVLHDDNGEIKQGRWSYLKWFGALFRTWVLAPIYAIYGVYMAGSGLRKTQALGDSSVNLVGSEEDWGFGQFLPMLLLALPVFAGWESFWEEKDKDRQNRFGRSTRTSNAGSRSVLNGFDLQKSPGSNHRSRDTSTEERRTGGNSQSPGGFPWQQTSTSQSPYAPIPMPVFPSPNLPIPSPSASPAIHQQRRP